jgi:hypothetical protein
MKGPTLFSAFLIYGWKVNGRTLFSAIQDMPPELLATGLRVVFAEGNREVVLGGVLASAPTDQNDMAVPVSFPAAPENLEAELRKGLEILKLSPGLIPEDRRAQLWLVVDGTKKETGSGAAGP